MKPTTIEDVARAVHDNHIWLNAFKCVNPTPEVCEQLGRQIIEMLNTKELLLAKYDGNISQETPEVQKALTEFSHLTPTLYLSINKS